MVTMKIYGYTYSDGSEVCAECATDTTDANNETGMAGAIFSTTEAHLDYVCDVCSDVFFEQNAGFDET
jgi:hypothetical protein